VRRIKNIFNTNKKSEYLKNILTVFTGSAVSQIITIVLAPVTLRLYLPADYGVLALYMSISGIVGIIVSSQYASAIILPKYDKVSRSLMYLALIISGTIALLILIGLLCFNLCFKDSFNATTLNFWLYFLPFSVICSGLTGILNNWNNRFKFYKINSVNRVIVTSLTVSIQIILGFFSAGEKGLIIAYLASQIIATYLLVNSSLRATKNLVSGFSAKTIFYSIKKYKKFALFGLPSDFINVFVNQLPVLALTKYTQPAVVGHYNQSNRLIGLPIHFISGSVGEVFKQKASHEYNTKGNCRSVFVKTFLTLFGLSIIPFTVLFFIAPDVFAFFFGENWRLSGEFSRIMILMFFLKFTVSPLTYTYFIAQKQVEDFIGHIYILITTIACFYFGFQFTNDVKIILLVYTLNYSLVFIIYFFRSYQFSSPMVLSNDKKKTK
jgi:O-antigen/teichoic acid export membrane protein